MEILIDCMKCGNEIKVEEEVWDKGIEFTCTNCGQKRFSKKHKKLKTLKDIQGIIMPISCEKGESINQVNITILKKFIIDYIKALDKNLDYWMSGGHPDKFPFPKLHEMCDYDETEIIKVLKHMFNITEEDLK